MAAFVYTGETIGAPAPSLVLPAADGERHSLGEFRGRPVLISFLGPAHCTICRAHVIKMIQARDEIARAGAGVILVAFSDPELLMSKMMRDLDVPFLLLLDRAREAYARWGLGRYSWRAWMNPVLYWRLFTLILQGHRSLGTAPNPNQLGGDFVVDRTGKLVFVNRMHGIHDRAPVADMLAALRAAS